MTPDQNPLSTAFADLAHAALRISGRMLDQLQPAKQTEIETAMRFGARLSIEISPLPEFEAVHLVLVEPEGMRHRIASVGLRSDSLVAH